MIMNKMAGGFRHGLCETVQFPGKGRQIGFPDWSIGIGFFDKTGEKLLVDND